MKTIYKYPVKFSSNDVIKVKMPISNKILSIKNQDELPVIYALVDTESPNEEFDIFMFPTGVELPDLWSKTYIDTVFFNDGKLVFHFYK